MLTSGTSGGAAPTYTIYTRGEGQLPNPNEWNSTLRSATREEMLTTRGEGQLPNSNEWNCTNSKRRSVYGCRMNSHRELIMTCHQFSSIVIGF